MKGINKMISAKEARKQTRLSRVSEDEVELLRIENEIKDAMNRGVCFIHSNGYLSKTIANELEKLGYKIYQGSQYNESYCSISW
jgi:hypothetical protein